MIRVLQWAAVIAGISISTAVVLATIVDALASPIRPTPVWVAVNEQVTTRQAICQVFRTRCWEAIRVAKCESSLRTTARNGQYLGLFQMGRWARSRYGHSHTARGQSIAAYRYFVDSGRDWSPWECRP